MLALQCGLLERVDIFERSAGGYGVPLHIQLGCGNNLRQQISLVELSGFANLCGEFRGHGLAGLVVLREMIEYLRIAGPMLVELRWEFDEVAGHVGAGEQRVLGGGEHSVQAMAELVEHGGDVGEADERGLARRGLGEVGDVVDDRQRAQQFRLADEVAHPRAAVLVVALEVVAVPERQRLAVGIEDLEDAYVGVVDGDVLALFEGDAVELVGGVEHAVLEDVEDLEVGLLLVFIDVVLRFAHLVGVELPVPGLQLEAAFLSVDQDWMSLPSSTAFAVAAGTRSSINLMAARAFWPSGLRAPTPQSGIAQQAAFVGAELCELGDGVAGVVGPAALGASPRLFKKRLARGAVVERR